MKFNSFFILHSSVTILPQNIFNIMEINSIINITIYIHGQRMKKEEFLNVFDKNFSWKRPNHHIFKSSQFREIDIHESLFSRNQISLEDITSKSNTISNESSADDIDLLQKSESNTSWENESDIELFEEFNFLSNDLGVPPNFEDLKLFEKDFSSTPISFDFFDD